MGVTTVSPSPASPTEGDDLCETDVTSVAIHSVTLLICLCGLVGNGAVLCLLRLKVRNAGNYHVLALFDIIVLLFTVPTTVVFLVEDVSCSIIMSPLYLIFLFSLSLTFCYAALFWLIFRSNIVYLQKFYKLCCRCDLSERWLRLLFSVPFWAFFVLFAVIPAVTNLCPSHQQEHCRAALISTYALLLLLFAAPILISTTIGFIKAKWGSKKQQPKRRSIVVFLIVVFILLLILCNFLQQIGYTVMSFEVFFLLNCIYSSIKPFIYYLAAGFQRPCSPRSLQLSLQRVFDEQEEETACRNDAPMDTGV